MSGVKLDQNLKQMPELDNKVVYLHPSKRGKKVDAVVDTMTSAISEYDGWSVTAVVSKAKSGRAMIRQARLASWPTSRLADQSAALTDLPACVLFG